MKAYILVNVRAGKIRGVVEKVRAVAGVQTAHACWGRPDIFAMVDVKDAGTLADTVMTKIQAIDGVESTDTRIVIE
jgi:DNA-binding Lrp family transcriptional regulator